LRAQHGAEARTRILRLVADMLAPEAKRRVATITDPHQQAAVQQRDDTRAEALTAGLWCR
jgi:hypothetical protein